MGNQVQFELDGERGRKEMKKKIQFYYFISKQQGKGV